MSGTTPSEMIVEPVPAPPDALGADDWTDPTGAPLRRGQRVWAMQGDYINQPIDVAEGIIEALAEYREPYSRPHRLVIIGQDAYQLQHVRACKAEAYALARAELLQAQVSHQRLANVAHQQMSALDVVEGA